MAKMSDPDSCLPDEAMKRRFLESDIPYRLQAIDGLAWYCGRSHRGTWFEGLELRVMGTPIPPQVFTNSVVEMGLASVRAISEFLGFKVDRRVDRLNPAVPRTQGNRQHNAGLEHFKGKTISPEEAIDAGFRGATPEATKEALVYALRVSNAAVAHLTYGPLGVRCRQVGARL